MTHYIYIFSPETLVAFDKSDRSIAGVRKNQSGIASKLEKGDLLICYVTKVSRWIGILEIESKSFEDDKPIFSDANDPFTMRFNVSPKVWLSLETAIPIHDNVCWNSLSFTKSLSKTSPKWSPMVRTSLRKLTQEDGKYLENILLQQQISLIGYPLSELDKAKLNKKNRIR